jgi:hypothetical protein
MSKEISFEELMEKRQENWTRKNRKQKIPKLDQKFKNRITNFLIKDQMGSEPTPAQVALKATNLVCEIINSDQKNIIALANLLQNMENFYKTGEDK